MPSLLYANHSHVHLHWLYISRLYFYNWRMCVYKLLSHTHRIFTLFVPLSCSWNTRLKWKFTRMSPSSECTLHQVCPFSLYEIVLRLDEILYGDHRYPLRVALLSKFLWTFPAWERALVKIPLWWTQMWNHVSLGRALSCEVNVSPGGSWTVCVGGTVICDTYWADFDKKERGRGEEELIWSRGLQEYGLLFLPV